jgi:kynurenine formamidase
MSRDRAIVVGLVLTLATGAASAEEDLRSKRWGPNDEIGSANHVTPKRVVEAARLVRTGKVYPLGIETSATTPSFPPRTFRITIVQPGQAGNDGLGRNRATYNDDILDGWMGTGSQIDGLGHIGVGHVYYQNTKLADFAHPTGLTKFGIEKVPPLVARGVVLDMTAHYGTGLVPEGTAFRRAEIEAVAKAQGIEIREGDVVLFHTGWLSLIGKDDARFQAGEPGLGLDGARYLIGKGVTAVGADNWGLEAVPGEDPALAFPVHQELIPRNGTYILENMNTGPLVADRAWEFLFVLGQPRITGAVQAIVNPVAIR